MASKKRRKKTSTKKTKKVGIEQIFIPDLNEHIVEKKKSPFWFILACVILIFVFIYMVAGCYYKSEEKTIAEEYKMTKFTMALDVAKLEAKCKETFKMKDSQFIALMQVLNTRDISDDTIWLKKNINTSQLNVVQQMIIDFNIDYNCKLDKLNVIKKKHDEMTKTFPSMLYFYNIKVFTGVTNESSRID